MTKTLETRNAYQLANLADVSSPDAPDSPGALMLLLVQSAVWELLRAESDSDADVLRDMVGQEIDGVAPSIYTHEKWQQFTDLAAWEEDLSEWVGPGSDYDMDRLSNLALWQIGERLAYRLIEEWEEIQADNETEAILADPEAMAAIAEADAEHGAK